MSDYYTGPSGQSLQKLGGTIANAMAGMADKLYQAEATGQYLKAYGALRKGLSQFDANLQTDSDWSTYGDKATQNDEKLYQDISPTIKNPAAQEQFAQAFAQERMAHNESVTRLATQRRIAETYGNITNTFDTVPDEVKDAGYTPDAIQSATQKIGQAVQAAKLLGGAEQSRAETLGRQALVNMYSGKLEREAFHVARDKGSIQEGVGYAVNADNSPNLNDSQRRSVATLVKTLYDDAFVQQTKQDAAYNDGIVVKSLQAFNAGQWGDQPRDQAIAQLRGGDRRTYADAIQNIGKGSRGLDPRYSNSLHIRAYNNGNPLGDQERQDMQLESAKALGEEKISETDWKEIQRELDPATKATADPVLTILANSITRGVSSTDPNASVYDRAKASFIVWARNNPRASPDELQKQSEFFHGIATKDVAVQAVKQLHSDVEPWAGVITHGYYKDRNAVTETVKQFGGGELYQLAQARNQTAMHVIGLAVQDFRSFVPNVFKPTGAVKVVAPDPKAPWSRTVAQLQDDAGVNYALGYDTANDVLDWWVQNPGADWQAVKKQ